MTLEQRVEAIMAHTEAIYGPIRDLRISREQAVEAFAGTHNSLMDGAL